MMLLTGCQNPKKNKEEYFYNKAIILNIDDNLHTCRKSNKKYDQGFNYLPEVKFLDKHISGIKLNEEHYLCYRIITPPTSRLIDTTYLFAVKK